MKRAHIYRVVAVIAVVVIILAAILPAFMGR